MRVFTGLIFCCLYTSALAQTRETDSLLTLLKKSPEDTNKAKLFRAVGGSVVFDDPRLGIFYWKQGAELSKRLGYIYGIARISSHLSIGYSYLGKLDSSLFYSDTAIYYSKLLPDVDLRALVYLNRADHYANLLMYTQALSYCDTALKFAEQSGNKDRLARIYHIRASVYDNQQQYSTCLVYYNKALEYYQQDKNIRMVAQIYSDFTLVYLEQHDPEKAIFYILKAIHLADSLNDVRNLSTYYLELATIYLDQVEFTKAEKELKKALEYAVQLDNNRQLTAVYSRLCYIELKEKRFERAVEYGKKSFEFARVEGALDFQHEASGYLAEAFEAQGNFREAFHYSQISKNLGDSIVRQKYDAQTSALQKAFEVQQKDKEIALLSKDALLQKAHIRAQRFTITGSLVIAALVIASLVMIFYRFRLGQRMKAMELRSRIAADLHDDVGSSLSSIHLLSQMAAMKSPQNVEQIEVLQRMSTNARETMEKMGDIVWMIKPTDHEGVSLEQRIERFLYELCSARNIDYSFTGAALLGNIRLSMEQKREVYLFIKEAINNSAKYSCGGRIDLHIEPENKDLRIAISDNGNGFEPAQISTGNGLNNMKKRANALHGSFSLQSSPGKGTKIILVMPFHLAK